LRQNLAGEDSDRLAMIGVSAARIGVDDFAAGEHLGREGVAARRALRHPAMSCPNGLLEIIDAPGGPVARSPSKVILNSRRDPSDAGARRKDFIAAPALPAKW
jgi:hypothetical protein